MTDAENNTEPKNVTAIVICYFTGPVLSRCLSSLRTQSEILEIVIIDNGSLEDQIKNAVEQSVENSSSPPVKIVSGHGNIGFAAACNKGAQAAIGDYLLFINPDAVLPEKGLTRLIDDADDFARPWMVGAKLIDPDGAEQQGSRRGVLTPWRAFIEATKLYKIAPQHPYFRRFNLHDQQSPAEVVAVPTISGACFV
ncbi:MAG: glycosyltransferase, partial [Marinicaulis sp.]|nr:glycosyltransferase [Marinicaulis sp.]